MTIIEEGLKALLGERVVVESKFAYIVGRLKRTGRNHYRVCPNEFSYIMFQATNVKAIDVDFIFIE